MNRCLHNSLTIRRRFVKSTTHYCYLGSNYRVCISRRRQERVRSRKQKVCNKLLIIDESKGENKNQYKANDFIPVRRKMTLLRTCMLFTNDLHNHLLPASNNNNSITLKI